MKHHARLATAILFIAAPLAAIPTQVTADITTNWTTEIVGVADGVRAVQLAGPADNVGLAYQRLNPSTVGFALRNNVGTWAIQNNDVTGVGSQMEDPDLCYVGPGQWIIAAKVTASDAVRIYRTTNSGQTWTETKLFIVTTWKGGLDCIGDVAALVYMSNAATPRVYFVKSQDAGQTWSTPQELGDNKISPTEVGTVRVADAGPVDVAMYDTTKFVASFRAQDVDGDETAYVVRSNDGGLFWSTPYAGDGSTTLVYGPSYGGIAGTYPGVAARSSTGILAISSFTDDATQPYVSTWNLPQGSASNARSLDSESSIDSHVFLAGDYAKRAKPAAIEGRTAVAVADDGAAGPHLSVWTRTDHTAAFSQIYAVGGKDTAGRHTTHLTTDTLYVAYADQANAGRLEVLRFALSNDVSTPPNCAPSTQTVDVGANAILTATGGTGTYAWSGGGTPGAGSAATFTTTYSTTGTKTVALTSGALNTTCTVNVGTGGQAPPPTAPDLPLPTTWSMEPATCVASSLSAGSRLVMAADGERLGIMYYQATTSRVGFCIRASDGTWTQKTADVVGGAGAGPESLVALGSSTWLAVVPDATSVKVWRTTNDGTSWTSVHNTAVALGNRAQVIGRVGNAVAAVAYVSSASGGIHVIISSDSGATWGSATTVSDNRGAPGVTGSAAATPVVNQASISMTDVDGVCCGLQVLYGSTSGVYPRLGLASTGLDRAFWGVNFGTGGACPVDGGTAWCPYPATGAATANWKDMTQSADGGLHMWRAGGGQAFTLTSDNAVTQKTINDCTTSFPWGEGPPMPLARNAADQYLFAESCSNPQFFKVYGWQRPSGTPTVVYSRTDIAPATYAVAMTSSTAYVLYINTAFGGRIELVKAAMPTTVSEVATVTTGSIIGFDVDPNGRTVITRENSGGCIDANHPNAIHTYAGGSLAAGPCLGNRCSRVDGVAALGGLQAGQWVTYTECLNDQRYVSELRIRNGNLGNPACPAGAGSECTGDITKNVKVPGDMKELGRVDTARWDFNSDTCHRAQLLGVPLPSICIAVISWTYSTSDGKVGIYSVKSTNDCQNVACPTQDRSGNAQVIFDPSSSNAQVNQLCSWRDTTTTGIGAKDLLGAAGQNVAPTLYAVDDGGPVSATAGITPTIAQYVSFPAFSGAHAISCGSNRVAVASHGKVAVLYATPEGSRPAGSVNWTTAAPGTTTRGLALSGDGRFLAYIDGASTKVVNLTSGAIVRTLTTPENFFEMRMDYTAQNLWIASRNKIYRYSIYEATTGAPKSPESVSSPVGPSPGGTDDGGATTCDAFFGCTSTGGGGGGGSGPAGGGFGVGGTGLFLVWSTAVGATFGVGPTIGGHLLATLLVGGIGMLVSLRDNRLGFIVGLLVFTLCLIVGWIHVGVVVILALVLGMKLVSKQKGWFG